MPRIARKAPGGVVYHVLNRGVGRMTLFEDDGDYAAFCRVLVDVQKLVPIRLCGYCLMPNHWHLVLWPERDGQLARFMQRLTITHVRRWVEHRGRVGWGSVYQGRYKSFAVQADAHFRAVVRYVERNPLRARLVDRAERWRWSSLGQLQRDGRPRYNRTPDMGAPAANDDNAADAVPLSAWPVLRPADWVARVNRAQTAAEEAAMLRSIQFGRPFGSSTWVTTMEQRLRLPPLRPRGRPRQTEAP